MTTRGASSALAIPAYRRVFASALVVIFGVMAQAIARAWLARDLTGSNTGLGGVMLAFGAAMLIATPFGGVAADRYAKRRVMAAAITTLVVSSGLIGLAVTLDSVKYWMLLTAGAIQATAFAFYLPARVAFIAEIVPVALLPNAIVTAQMAQEVGRVIAPALAGALLGVAWFGVGGVFLAAAATCTGALMLLVGLPRGEPSGQSGRSALAEAFDAFEYTRRTEGLGVIALLMVSVVMVGFPYLTFLPTLANDRYEVGAVGFGVMSATSGAGALAAGALVASNDNQRPWLTISVAATVLGVSLAGLGLAPSLPIALVALVAVGGSGLVFQTGCQTLMLQLSAVEFHGRVQSFLIVGFSGFGLAALPLGLVADATSVGATLVGMGVVVLAMATLFAWARWRLRQERAAVAGKSIPPTSYLPEVPAERGFPT